MGITERDWFDPARLFDEGYPEDISSAMRRFEPIRQAVPDHPLSFGHPCHNTSGRARAGDRFVGCMRDDERHPGSEKPRQQAPGGPEQHQLPINAAGKPKQLHRPVS